MYGPSSNVRATVPGTVQLSMIVPNGTEDTAAAAKGAGLADWTRGAGFGPVPAQGAMPPPDSVPRSGAGAERTAEAQEVRRMSLRVEIMVRISKHSCVDSVKARRCK